MRLELLSARQRSLAVTACEWRAFDLADPQRMADEVFDRLIDDPDPGLTELYREIDTVVSLTYERHAAQFSILDRLRSGMAMSGRPSVPDLLDTFSQLRHKDRYLLQLLYWDSLSIEEAAEVLNRAPEEIAERLAKARSRFAKRLASRHSERAGGDIDEIISGLKPGVHVRIRN